RGSRPMEGIRRIVLISNPLDTVLVSRRHPLASRVVVKLEELASTPLLFISRAFSSLIFDRVMTAFAHHGFSPRIESSYDGLNTTWALVQGGLGWCLAGHSQRETPPPGTVPLALEDFSIPWDVELLYRRDETRAPVLAVIAAIQMKAVAFSGVPAPKDFRLSHGDTSKAAIP
ncbi:MAG: LysR family substrate-binding domain-containing protein, partial [Gemmatimonadaceae bacterium]